MVFIWLSSDIRLVQAGGPFYWGTGVALISVYICTKFLSEVCAGVI